MNDVLVPIRIVEYEYGSVRAGRRRQEGIEGRLRFRLPNIFLQHAVGCKEFDAVYVRCAERDAPGVVDSGPLDVPEVVIRFEVGDRADLPERWNIRAYGGEDRLRERRVFLHGWAVAHQRQQHVKSVPNGRSRDDEASLHREEPVPDLRFGGPREADGLHAAERDGFARTREVSRVLRERPFDLVQQPFPSGFRNALEPRHERDERREGIPARLLSPDEAGRVAIEHRRPVGGYEDGEGLRPPAHERSGGFGGSAESAGRNKDERRCCENASRIHGRHSFPGHGFTGQKYIPAGYVADRFSYRTGCPDSTTGLLCPSRNSSV